MGNIDWLPIAELPQEGWQEMLFWADGEAVLGWHCDGKPLFDVQGSSEPVEGATHFAEINAP